MTEKQKLRASQRDRLALAQAARADGEPGGTRFAASSAAVSRKSMSHRFAVRAILALMSSVQRAGVWLCFLGRSTEFRLQELLLEIDPVLSRTQSRLALPRLKASASTSALAGASDLAFVSAADMDFFVYQGDLQSSLLRFVRPNSMGIDEPDLQSHAAQARWQSMHGPAGIHVHGVFVPGAAFDRDLNRLGWGRGYYDRFLPKLDQVPWVGLGLNESMVDRVPTEAHDQNLDGVLSETEWTCGRSLHWKMNVQGERG